MDINDFLKWNREGGTLDMPGYSSDMGASAAGYTNGMMDGIQVNPGTPGTSGDGSWFDSINWMDKIDPKTGMKSQGALGLGLGAANGLFNGWLGYKKLGIAKDQLRENKRQFDMNWGAQKKMVNNQLLNQKRSQMGNKEEAAKFNEAEFLAKRGIQ